MKKFSLVLILILLFVFLFGCTKIDYQKKTLEITDNYIKSLNDKNLDIQSEILKPFKMDMNSYNYNFLEYVKSAKKIESKVVYEDKYIVIVEVVFDLVLDNDFKSNSSFKSGYNHCKRYFTYKKKNMQLVEVLNKFVADKEKSWIK